MWILKSHYNTMCLIYLFWFLQIYIIKMQISSIFLNIYILQFTELLSDDNASFIIWLYVLTSITAQADA